MSKTKRVFRKFEYYEADAFAEYLEEMAKRGWHLVKWSNGLIFESGDPREDVYDVQVFPKGKEDDKCPSEPALDMAAYCEEAGWELVDGQGKFVIFRHGKEMQAEPIVTEEERYVNIKNASRGKNKGDMILSIVGIFCFCVLPLIGDGVDFWFDSLGLALALLCTFVFISNLYHIIVREVILKRYGKALENGERVYLKNSRFRVLTAYAGVVLSCLIISFFAYTGYGALPVILIIAIYVIFIIISIVTNEEKFDRIAMGNLNIFLIFVVIFAIIVLTASLVASQDSSKSGDAPLTMADYVENFIDSPTDVFIEENDSIFGTSVIYELSYPEDYLDYTIYDCKSSGMASFIYDISARLSASGPLGNGKWQSVDGEDADSWHADRVYYSADEGFWYVLKDSRIIRFADEGFITSDQMCIVGEKLVK